MGTLVSQHLEKLLEQKETPLWGGYVNMLKTLESLFQSPKHWVLEFLQNAEDASKDKKGASISIQAGKDFLKIFNNGKIFDENDFKTICNVESQKLPSLGFRGYIGIGFKSIFRVTNRIDIHSGNYHFKFDKLYWDESKRREIPLSKWPWEVLPVEIKPELLPEGYTTGFYAPNLKEIEIFFISDFPKEAILMLENIENIDIQTPQSSFTVTKELIPDYSAILPFGKKDLFVVTKQIDGQKYPEESNYLVFRKTISVDKEILQDEETERVRRSDVTQRDIGIVFQLDSGKNIQPLPSKLAGVYSFLPVEGEQTGMPFGIFGDFIPLPGRDLISYGAKWNHMMCDKLVDFFKEIVREVFLSHEQWMDFPAVLLKSLQDRSRGLSGASEKFWGDKLKNPIKDFLESEDCYFDIDGNRRKLEELMVVDEEIEAIIGKNILEEKTGKKIAHPRIRKSIQQKIKDENSIIKHNIASKKVITESLKGEPEKLSKLYQICSLSRSDSFVLAEDGELYTLEEVVNPRIDLNNVGKVLKPAIPKNKKLLHPEIAKNTEVVDRLALSGLKVIDQKTVITELQSIINNITSYQIPEDWEYPDDLIEATLLLISKGIKPISLFVDNNNALQEPKNLFLPGGLLDWMPLWESHCLPGFQPIHNKYIQKEMLEKYGLSHKDINDREVHGVEAKKDIGLITRAAVVIAKEKLKQEGHKIETVENHDRLGYDLQCMGHCTKVFEVKGMSEPTDILLGENHYKAAREKGDDYVLICVYSLPNSLDKIGYKEILNPVKLGICEPVEKANIPKNKWFGA